MALDTAHVLHMAKMTGDQPLIKDIMVCPIFESPASNESEPSVLPCSVAVRCGVLCFVEAKSIESHQRVLHIWQLASQGDILPAPKRQTFEFSTQGHAAVSVPKPIFGRFVVLKNCCVVEDGESLLSIQILDINQRLPLYQVCTSARDSTLFRRGHPLTDFLLGFWNETPGTCSRKLLLVNLAAEKLGRCGNAKREVATFDRHCQAALKELSGGQEMSAAAFFGSPVFCRSAMGKNILTYYDMQ